jgi:hypothetical protein
MAIYQNAQYFSSPLASPASIFVDINGIPSFVPIDPANGDYTNIIALVAAGQLVVKPAA